MIGSAIGLFLLLGGIGLYKTFAVYEVKKEFNILRGRIPSFSGGDMILSFTIDGVSQSEKLFPNKEEGYDASSVTCKNGVTAEWNSTLWGLVNVKNTSSTKIDCTINFTSQVQLSSVAAVGNYISYTPTVQNYAIAGSLTGVSGSQNINPSELNLWRVIKRNSDGTIELVSEYASSKQLSFNGRTGYKNYVGVLNTIAKQYETSGITSASRYFGYHGQTEYVSICTASSCTEPNGGEDNGPSDDVDLVTKAIGNAKANAKGTETGVSYWLSRRYYYCSTWGNIEYWIYVINSAGATGLSIDDGCRLCGTSYGGDVTKSHNLRPIVVLNSGLKAIGTGTKESPYKIN